MRRVLAVVVVAALAPASCAQHSLHPVPAAPAAAASPVDLDSVRIRLQPVADIPSALAMAFRPGDPSLYVATKTGEVLAMRDGRDPRRVLDVSGAISAGVERGLLGLAFSPDGRFLYLDYTDRRGDTNVVEYAMGDGGAPDPSTARLVLLVQQPRPTHNGGDLAFGPDGDLYIAMGDGGGAGDPYGNGQDLGVLLGKILRIDPRPSDDEPYEVPGDNPFVGRAGTDSEIWAYGLRNPWRFSFDRETGDLWIGDVGQMSWEEVDHEPAGIGGENYGWDGMEGTHARAGAPPVIGQVAPVFEYPHEGGGCAVIGGYVYRGRAIPSLRGAYVFTDLCTGDVMAFRLRGVWAEDVTDLGSHIDSPVSFGEDQEGELYVLSLTRGVVKIVPGS